MISFLSPLFLAGAVAAAIPIVLHLLRRDPERRVRFSAVDLLTHAPVEQTDRRHLRELLLLALRVAALLLLAVAFARPYFSSGLAAASSGITVVALDVSMSLSGPGQFDRAKQLARTSIDSAPSGDLVGVVTFADRAEQASRPSLDRALARDAIDRAAPGFGSTHYRSALERAADMINASGAARSTIVLVSDMQESGWDGGDRASVPQSTSIQLADAGAPPSNLAVTALRVAADRLIATVRNTAPQPRQARVRTMVSAGGNTSSREAETAAGEASTEVGPNQSADVVMPAPHGRWARVSVEDSNGIEGDNSRYIVLGDAGRASVLLVTSAGDVAREAFYLEQGLIAGGKGDAAFNVTGVAAAQLSSWTDTSINAQRAVVVLSTRGLERRGRQLLSDFLLKGGGVLVVAGPEIDGAVITDMVGNAKMLSISAAAEERSPRLQEVRRLAPADLRHPIFQPFGAGATSLGLTTFRRAMVIDAPGCQVVARFTTSEPALVDCSPGEGRLLVFASDFDNRWNDFPLHATFVPFVREAVRYLTIRPASVEYLVGDVPAGIPDVPGVATLHETAGIDRLVAVNVNPKESDPARLSAEEFQSAVTRLKDADRGAVRLELRDHEDRQHIWQYVLGVMLAVLVVESLVARRVA